MPWPISALHIMIVTLLSAEILTQPFSATCVPCAGSGVEVVRRCPGGNTDQPTSSAPKAPAPPSRKVLRFNMT